MLILNPLQLFTYLAVTITCIRSVACSLTNGLDPTFRAVEISPKVFRVRADQ